MKHLFDAAERRFFYSIENHRAAQQRFSLDPRAKEKKKRLDVLRDEETEEFFSRQILNILIVSELIAIFCDSLERHETFFCFLLFSN